MAEISEGEYKRTIQTCWMVAALVKDLQITEALDALSHSQAIVPFLDPTLYIANGDKARQDGDIMKAVKVVQDTLNKMERERHGL